MDPEHDRSQVTSAVQQLYGDLAAPVATANEVLADADATTAERAEALWTLGQAAFYANRMGEAVGLLQEAARLAEESGGLQQVVLNLSRSMSKIGQAESALRLLGEASDGLDEALASEFRTQRGCILAELGRLHEAETDLRLAVELADRAGDTARGARTRVNLGAALSEMGRLAEAEEVYRGARSVSTETGQHLVVAMIDGNLGYIESRRGNFPAAFAWYAKARSGFEELGQAELPLATLEVDHARTLLDVGLAEEALTAAELARRSADAGGNQMLAAQALLLEAEALVGLGEARAAREALERSRSMARELGREPLELQASYLAGATRLDGAEVDADHPIGSDADIDRFVEAGWYREALTCVIHRARLSRSDPDRARQLLDRIDRWRDEVVIDPVDRAAADLVRADVDGDVEAAMRALGRGLDALDQQRALAGAVELTASILVRMRDLVELATTVALASDEPAPMVLAVLEQGRSRFARTMLDRGLRSGSGGEVTMALRDARVELAQRKLIDGDVREARERLDRLERRVLEGRRAKAATDTVTRPASGPDLSGGAVAPEDVALVTYAIADGRIHGLVHDAGRSSMVELGSAARARNLVRSQRQMLRRLADERRAPTVAAWQRLIDTNDELSEFLIEPLQVPAGTARLAVIPANFLYGLAWAALPGLADRPITVAQSVHRWQDSEPVAVRDVRVVTGPDLAMAAAEAEVVADLWARTGPGGAAVQARPATTGEQFLADLEAGDLMHVAAHGRIRSGNSFLSTLEFEDGPISLLEIGERASVPGCVVLASCDAAATDARDDSQANSTALVLHYFGAGIVVGPTVEVNDRCAAVYSRLLHTRLAAGQPADEAMAEVRRELVASDDLRDRATALAFQLIGGRAATQPIRIG